MSISLSLHRETILCLSSKPSAADGAPQAGMPGRGDQQGKTSFSVHLTWTLGE